MKRIGTIAAVGVLSAVLLAGFVSVHREDHHEPDTLASEQEPGSQARRLQTRTAPPRLSVEVRAGQGESGAEGGKPERSLAKLEQEAREVSVSLGQERDAVKREKLERYARSIKEMREHLR